MEEEDRRICWDCEKQFSIELKYWLPKEKGQKQYIKCNNCGKVNHL